jgi:HPt (histidine-containing phosphotransfer) domain-containing protein
MSMKSGYLDSDLIPRSLLLERDQSVACETSREPPAPVEEISKAASSENGEAIPCNLEELKRRCMGHMDFVERLLQSFENRFPVEVLEIGKCLAERDISRTSRLVHQLKGATANICAPGLHQILLQIEGTIRAERFDETTRLLSVLEQEWTRFVDFKQAMGNHVEA